MELKGSFMDTLDHQTDEQVGPRTNVAGNILGGKHDKTSAVQLWAHPEKASSLEKRIMLGAIEDGRKNRVNPNVRWIDSIKEDIGLREQELSRVVDNRTSLICRVTQSLN